MRFLIISFFFAAPKLVGARASPLDIDLCAATAHHSHGRYKKAKRMRVTVIASIPIRMRNARTSHMNSNKFWTFNNFFVAEFFFVRFRFSVFAFAAPKKTRMWAKIDLTYKRVDLWCCWWRTISCARCSGGVNPVNWQKFQFGIITFTCLYLFNLHLKEIFRNMNNACSRWIWINHRLPPSTALHHSD